MSDEFQYFSDPLPEPQPRRLSQKQLAIIITAALAACVVFLVLLMTVILPAHRYRSGVAMGKAGDYQGAIQAFESLGTYRDAQEQLSAAYYLQGDAFLDKGNYTGALNSFRAAGNFRNAPDRVCEAAYLQAEVVAAEGSFSKAADLFELAGDYRDAKTQLNICRMNLAEAGDAVFFGRYEQDNDASNGAEQIQWRVLDKQDDRILVVSEYVLDAQPFTPWGGLSLDGQWLNLEFLPAAFTPQERARILTQNIPCPDNPHISTPSSYSQEAAVFLLSVGEAEKYFSSDADRQAAPTGYAKAQGVYVSNSGASWWWLRSPGYGQMLFTTASVLDSGAIHDGSTSDLPSGGVRPAMWIALS